MKNRNRFIIVLVINFLSISSVLLSKNHKNIFCIGQEFSDGTSMILPDKNKFPAQLASILGNEYNVTLNGHSVHASNRMSSWGDILFSIEQLETRQGDIVLLDINTVIDSIYYDQLKYDRLKNKIDYLKKIGTRVVLLKSPQIDASQNKSKPQNVLYDIAFNDNVEIVDFARLLKSDIDVSREGYLTSVGATIVSKRLYELIMTPILSEEEVVVLDIENSVPDNFYGYSCLNFNFNNRSAKIVQPKIIAEGKPWIWRARFWGHEPQLDIAMLERGYHIVYCDVVELYGNSTSIEIWNQFYHFLQEMGFNKRSVMEGMSRGGVYVYNWLATYPYRVSAVYADAPVLSLLSWPGGKGKGSGSADDWQLFKEYYQLSEQEAIEFNDSPLDKATKIGLFRIPLLHVIGDKDTVVPPEENTLPFVEEIKKVGGVIEVIHKSDVGHHPHSLVNPTKIVNFILQAEKRKINI